MAEQGRSWRGRVGPRLEPIGQPRLPQELLTLQLQLQLQLQLLGQPRLLPQELHTTQAFSNMYRAMCILDIQVQSYVMNNRQNLNLNM